MANDGFFKCETPGCGYTIKVYVRDWQAEQGVLTTKRCPRCGGKLTNKLSVSLLILCWRRNRKLL